MTFTTSSLPLRRADAPPRVRCDADSAKPARVSRKQVVSGHTTPTQHPTRTERWTPPKPLVGQRTIEKVLTRHTAVRCPKSQLVVAMISLAVVDCLSLTNRSLRREARRFVLGEDLVRWCELIGLNPDFVRFVARKAGYLAQAPQSATEPATLNADPIPLSQGECS